MTPARLPIILIVEDDADLADLYADWLRSSYDVRVAHSGEDALDAADETVDVVLLDRRLPDMSGDEVLDEFHSIGLDCRVAMLTGVEIDFDVIDMRFDTYVEKPVSETELKDIVKMLLTRTMFDDRMQRYLELVSKTEALESHMEEENLSASDEYAGLQAEKRNLRAELEYIIRRLDEDYFTASVLQLGDGEDEPEFEIDL